MQKIFVCFFKCYSQSNLTSADRVPFMFPYLSHHIPMFCFENISVLDYGLSQASLKVLRSNLYRRNSQVNHLNQKAKVILDFSCPIKEELPNNYCLEVTAFLPVLTSYSRHSFLLTVAWLVNAFFSLWYTYILTNQSPIIYLWEIIDNFLREI